MKLSKGSRIVGAILFAALIICSIYWKISGEKILLLKGLILVFLILLTILFRRNNKINNTNKF